MAPQIEDAEYVAERRSCTSFARGAGAGTSGGLNSSYTSDLAGCLGDLSFFPDDWAYDAENDRHVLVTGTDDRCGDCGPAQGKHVSVTYRLNADNSATRIRDYVDKPAPGVQDYTRDGLLALGGVSCSGAGFLGARGYFTFIDQALSEDYGALTTFTRELSEDLILHSLEGLGVRGAAVAGAAPVSVGATAYDYLFC